MGLQGGINYLQDKATTFDHTLGTINNISVDQQHKGITFGSNLGAVVGHQFFFYPWTLGAEARLTLSEFNHTRKLQLDHLSTNQFYTVSHVTKVNNFTLFLIKPGRLLPNNMILYSQLGLGLISTKIDTFQTLTTNNLFHGVQFTQSEKLPAGVLGLGLEMILSPNISLYYDFNVALLKQISLSNNQLQDGVSYHATSQIQQDLFQGILGLKWQSLQPYKQTHQAPACGWHVALGLGLMQANLTTRFANATSNQNPFLVDNRVATITPSFDVLAGYHFPFSHYILIAEAFGNYHPHKTTENPKVWLQITPNESAQLDQHLSTGPTIGLTLKPGLNIMSRFFYLIFGMGQTRIDVNLDKTVWPFFYLTGWGIQSPLSQYVSLRAEYQLAFANRVSDVHNGPISTKNEKLVHQKGSLALVYHI